jgi:hypothetical protein
MARLLLSVLAGCATMFVPVMATFSIVYIAMGADRAFLPGTYGVSGLWVVASILLGFGAALLGGAVCTAMAKRPGPARVLAGLVLRPRLAAIA